MRRWLLLACLSACSLITPLSDLTSGDAGGEGSAGEGGPPACDRSKPFSPPVMVEGLNMANYSSSSARLTRDELTVYFNASWPGGAGLADVMVATRANVGAPFGGAMRVTGVNSTAEDWDPTITDDELTLYFGSTRVSPEDLFVATRPSKAIAFVSPMPVASVNTDASDMESTIVGNSKALYFVSNRPGGAGSTDIYRAEGRTNGFLPPIGLANVNTAAGERAAVVSSDELTLLLASSRSGGAGALDIYLSRRTSTALAFDVPINVIELNTEENDYPSWISDDGCRALIMSHRSDPMHNHIYETSRPK